MFEKLNPQTKGEEDLKEKAKENAGDKYQDKYNEEKMA